MSEPTGVLGDEMWPGHVPAAPDTVQLDTLPHGRRQTPAGAPSGMRRNGLEPGGERQRPAGWRLLVRAATRLLGGGVADGLPQTTSGLSLTPRQLVRGLSRPTRTRALRRLGLLPCFRAADYLTLNRDVAVSRVPANFHALFLGAHEGRKLFRPEAVARTLATLTVREAGCLEATIPSLAALVARAPRVGVYVSTQGNVFMREIAEDLATSLRRAGVAAELLDETTDVATRPKLCVFVAPHEFFLLGQGPRWVRDDVVASAVMLNTEQVQTSWFVRALPFVLASRGVIDLCAQTCELFGRTGLPSMHVGLTPPDGAGRLGASDRQHPLFRVLPAAARADPLACSKLADRPIEIAFFGAESPHREAWLARNAGFLAEYDTFIHLRRMARGPIRPGTPDGALTRLARHVCGHARISLNLHRDAFAYLEWHRIVRLGMASGSVVVSEPCLPHPVLRPGVHYFEENTRQIPDLLEWLLRSEDGRRRAAAVQGHAAALLAADPDGRRTAARVLSFLLDGAVAA